MAAEELPRTKLFVNKEWTAETCPVTIDGVELKWGENAFNDAFAAIAVARESTTPVEINVTGDFLTTNMSINFVSSTDKAGTDGWYVSDADILFTGTGTVKGKYFGRGNGTSDKPKGSGQTITIAAGTTVLSDVGEGQASFDGNTINVYGTFGTQILRIAEHGGGELNIYSGGVAKIGYLSATNSNNAATSPVINVIGDGKAYGNAQLIFTLVNSADNEVDNAMVINVTDYGVMSLQRTGDYKANSFVVRGDQQLNLTNGKLEYATDGTLTVQGKGKFSMSGASTAEVTVMNVNDTASVVIDANSSLSVTESLTIAETASFSIDFTNYDFTKASGSQTILSAGAITGNVAVLDPLKVIIDNFPEGQIDEVDVINNPEDPESGTRKVAFTRELYIERDDFMEEPVKQFKRLAPGREVRLRCAYFVTCNSVDKDAEGNITALHCTYDPETRGGNAPDGRKVKGTIHWVSATEAVAAEVRLYDHLFTIADTAAIPEDEDYKNYLNPESLVVKTAYLEPSLATAEPGFRCQFERVGYFCADAKDHVPGEKAVYNRTVALKDSWAKIAAK